MVTGTGPSPFAAASNRLCHRSLRKITTLDDNAPGEVKSHYIATPHIEEPTCAGRHRSHILIRIRMPNNSAIRAAQIS